MLLVKLTENCYLDESQIASIYFQAPSQGQGHLVVTVTLTRPKSIPFTFRGEEAEALKFFLEHSELGLIRGLVLDVPELYKNREKIQGAIAEAKLRLENMRALGSELGFGSGELSGLLKKKKMVN